MKNSLKKLDVKVLILSRGRHTSITTHLLLPDYIEILVPESQKSLYEKTVENPILTTPDDVMGLGMLRNWVVDNFKERTVIMIDDDVDHVYCLTGIKSKQITDKEKLLQIIINTYIMADDLGVSLFGFSQTDIRKYNGCEPFKLNTWVGCLVGVIGKNKRFRDDKFKVDIDFTLECLLIDRIIFCDNRYYFSQKRDCNTGGNASFRTKELYEKSCETLKDKWGKYISITNHKNQKRIRINVKRKQSLKIGENTYE